MSHYHNILLASLSVCIIFFIVEINLYNLCSTTIKIPTYSMTYFKPPDNVKNKTAANKTNIKNVMKYSYSVNNTLKLLNFNRKYIRATYKYCGGLGNQMFRFASLYGIGRELRRKPYYEKSIACQTKEMIEIKEIFPNFYYAYPEKTTPMKNIINLKFTDNSSCKYEPINRLHNHAQKYMILTGDYLQSYKFFHLYRKDLTTEYFKFHPKVIQKVEQDTKQQLINKPSHKLCVHIRRRDFITSEKILQSKMQFLISSIDYATEYIKKQLPNSPISILFIGDDYNFATWTRIKRKLYQQVYIRPSNKSRGEDLYFGVKNCDSIILTASASTFGFWIAYLKENPGYVFYNKRAGKFGNICKDVHSYDYFLPEWIGLKLNWTTKKVVQSLEALQESYSK